MNATATRGSTKEGATEEWITVIIITPMLMMASFLLTWVVFATSNNHITNPIILALVVALGSFFVKGISQDAPFSDKKSLYVGGYAACISLMASVGLMFYYYP